MLCFCMKSFDTKVMNFVAWRESRGENKETHFYYAVVSAANFDKSETRPSIRIVANWPFFVGYFSVAVFPLSSTAYLSQICFQIIWNSSRGEENLKTRTF